VCRLGIYDGRLKFHQATMSHLNLQELENGSRHGRKYFGRSCAKLRTEMRRSSARPRAWRTRSENEEAFRRYEEERLSAAASIAETMVRLDAERGRRRS
jgi:hypothetical protein